MQLTFSVRGRSMGWAQRMFASPFKLHRCFCLLFSVHLWTGRMHGQNGSYAPPFAIIPKWQSYRLTAPVLLQPQRSRSNRSPESLGRKLQQVGVDQYGMAAWHRGIGYCCHSNSGLFGVVQAASKRLWKNGWKFHPATTTDSLRQWQPAQEYSGLRTAEDSHGGCSVFQFRGLEWTVLAFSFSIL